MDTIRDQYFGPKQQCEAMVKSEVEGKMRRCEQQEWLTGSGWCQWHQGSKQRIRRVLERQVWRMVLTKMSSGAIQQVQEKGAGGIISDSNPIQTMHETLAEVKWWKDKMFGVVEKLDVKEWRYLDKAGAEQLHSYIALYERSLDRAVRAAQALAKLNIEERILVFNERQAAVMVYALSKTLEQLGIEASDEVNQLLIQHLSEASREMPRVIEGSAA